MAVSGFNSVNPNPDRFTFIIGKGLSDSGSGSTSNVVAAMNKCAEDGADVISLSLGGGGFSNTFNNAANDWWAAGRLMIAAAGNGGNNALSYPASYKSMMSVAAVDSGETKAGFSQYNSQVEIAGPGFINFFLSRAAFTSVVTGRARAKGST